MVIIPFKDLESETLDALLEEIASRDGTDYGAHELSLEQKIEQIKVSLSRGEAVVCYDQLTESCTIAAKEDAEKLIV